MLRIITLNFNGIRAAFRKGVAHWLAAQNADIICVQELKAQETDLAEEMRKVANCIGYFHCAEKKGYSGVGLYCRQPPDNVVTSIGNNFFDAEGRYLRADFGSLSIISVYLPSGASSPERQVAKFAFMDLFFPLLAHLRTEEREIVICGDWNIAHREIDLKNWKSNQKNSGFLPEERAWMARVLGELGWVDIYRHLHPDVGEASYTWWSNRGNAWKKNVGWRIDYQLATPLLANTACTALVYKNERFSDHAPLCVDYDWPLQ